MRLSADHRAILADITDDEVGRALTGARGAPAALDLREAFGATLSAALPAAADAWCGVLAPLGVSARLLGAFSFGAPIVEFRDQGALRRCGLGAFMLIVDDRTGAVPQRRALLVRSRLRATADAAFDAAQRRLFSAWPPFRFAGSANACTPRCIGAPRRATDTGFAEIEPCGHRPGWELDTHGRDASRLSLGAALTAMATGGAGRGAIIGGGDPWSQTVEDTLRRTAAAAMAGLAPHPTIRSAATYKGHWGTGFAVFENATDLPLEQSLTQVPDLPATPAEGPLSLAHLILSPLAGGAHAH